MTEPPVSTHPDALPSGEKKEPPLAAVLSPRAAADVGDDLSVLPRILVHSLGDARAALLAAAETGQEIVLLSAPSAASYVGPGWFRAVVTAAHQAEPEGRCVALLDCGDDAGSAAVALAAGIGVRFTGRESAAARLADIARSVGVPFDPGVQRTPAGRVLDLAGASDPAASCRGFLARNRAAG